jgi:hypothetical protein
MTTWQSRIRPTRPAVAVSPAFVSPTGSTERTGESAVVHYKVGTVLAASAGTIGAKVQSGDVNDRNVGLILEFKFARGLA